jgi:hypothetical protein
MTPQRLYEDFPEVSAIDQYIQELARREYMLLYLKCVECQSTECATCENLHRRLDLKITS